MKNAHILILILITSVFFSCKKEPVTDKPDNTNNTSTPLATNLPNGDFELWTTSTEGTFEEPSTGWWTSLNILKNLGAPKLFSKQPIKTQVPMQLNW